MACAGWGQDEGWVDGNLVQDFVNFVFLFGV